MDEMSGEDGGGLPLDRYPREIVLRSGTRLLLRPMVREDADSLWAFFRRIPPGDRMFFRQDVSRRETVQRWADTLDYNRILPVLALDGGRVAGDATLHRRTAGWKQRVGVVRVQIAPDYRHQGLGTAMVRELRHLGEKAGLRYLMAEVIEEQSAALAAFEKLGFARAAVYRDFVNDQGGRLHNLVILLYAMPSTPNG
jgi:RimJ/RimL family protein N-acetyltransferase